MGGKPVAPDTWAVAVSPVRLDDSRVLNWHPPQPVAFAVIEAARYVTRGERQRRRIMGSLRARPNAAYEPPNSRAVIDCISDLSVAVLFAFTAIESLANHSIDQLSDDAIVQVEFKQGEVREVTKAEMVRRLRIEEKLAQAVPMLDDARSIKGTHPWERFLHLKKLRDDLVHVKERGYSPDPDERTAYDRLLLGDGDSCARDAYLVITAARPGFLPEHVAEELDRFQR